MNYVSKSLELAPDKTLVLETGKLAKQADGAVVARIGDTMVLCTVVITKESREGQNFFPLTVDYREKYAAGGKIPGGFIKREGRPNDKEVLSSRLVDRCIRPLFPDGFYHETQVMLSVVSADGENDADVVAGVGASAAMLLTGAPYGGPVGEVRVGRVNGDFVIYPTVSELESSDFDLVVAGTENAIVMVEGEMDEVDEDDIVAALDYAHTFIRLICKMQHDLLEEAGGAPDREFQYGGLVDGVVALVEPLVKDALETHIRKPYDKVTFYSGIDEIKEHAIEQLLHEKGPDGETVVLEETKDGYTAADIKAAVSDVERTLMRQMIVNEQRRIDGRSLTDIRTVTAEIAYLPRAHGSAVFTRGETQALASVTLGGSRDVQAVDQVFDTTDKTFFLHYSFPPFCVGEVRRFFGPARREIGHGFLAERALSKVLPDQDSFPYTIRVVSDVLESNGSSSMATVCAGSLSLMDAGVPVKKAVSGIAMGLIEEAGKTVVLSDILGTEDHLGDMDFKITGTRDGVTACQMDIKIDGLSKELMSDALAQARTGRHFILDRMEEAISAPREELSPYAPRLTTLEIDTEFIGAIIGPGGKVIQGIQRETDTKIDIEEKEGKGFVTIASADQEQMARAVELVRQIVAVPEVGTDYEGTVVSIQPFGAIIEILPGKEGLLHVSEIDHGYVDKVEDYLQMGDTVKVQLIEIRDDGKLRLSRKPFLEKSSDQDDRRQQDRRRDDRRRDGGGRRGGDNRRGGGRNNRGRGQRR